MYESSVKAIYGDIHTVFIVYSFCTEVQYMCYSISILQINTKLLASDLLHTD